MRPSQLYFISGPIVLSSYSLGSVTGLIYILEFDISGSVVSSRQVVY